ncbi:MAG: T9SS type A sorting domain-containing protein [Bacteroidota bacterium]
MHRFLLVLSIIYLTFSTQAQGWYEEFGTSDSDYPQKILPQADSSMIVFYKVDELETSLFLQYELAKISKDGALLWQRTLEEVGEHFVADVEQLPDGGFAVLSNSHSTTTDLQQMQLMKLDEHGATAWLRRFGDTMELNANDLLITSDEGFLISGYCVKEDVGVPVWEDQDYYLLKLDSLGVEEWTHSGGLAGTSRQEEAISTYETDSFYHVLTDWEISTPVDLRALRLDKNGNATGLHALQEGWFMKGFRDRDGNYISYYISENSVTPFFLEYIISKHSPDGELLWRRSYDFQGSTIRGWSLYMVQSPDGGYLLAHDGIKTLAPSSSLYLLKMNANGQTEWTRELETGDVASLLGVRRSTEGGYLLFGTPNIYETLDQRSDYFVMKLDELGYRYGNFIKLRVAAEQDSCFIIPGMGSIENQLIELSGATTQRVYTDTAGCYLANVDTGTYRIQLPLNNDYWAPCEEAYIVEVHLRDSAVIDISLRAVVDCPYLTIDVATPFLRRCFNNYYVVHYCNQGTIEAEDAHVQIQLDESMVLESASLPYLDNGGQLFTFSVGDIAPGACGSFRLDFNLSCTTMLGEEHCVTAQIYPDTLCTDAAIPRFFVENCQENIGSWDPNDKHAFPEGVGERHVIAPGTTIDYRIRFQNTGTDTAFQVAILDTLSPHIDLHSIQFGAASHPYQVGWSSERTLLFLFNNANLPDSTTNLAASMGFVTFEATVKEETPLESVIENSAAIYFDFNEPIFTNEVFHTVDVISNTVSAPSATPIQVYPNPTTQAITFELDRSYPTIQVVLYDLQGRRVHNAHFSGRSFQLAKPERLNSGSYIFQLQAGSQILGAGKLIFK